MIRTAAPVLEELRAWAGLEPDPEGRKLDEAPYLTLTPPSLEAPGVTVASRTLRFHDAAPRPHSVRDPGEPPLVYVTFGTVAPTLGRFPELYRSVIDALADLRLRLVMTVGDAADPAELGPLPDNVRVERWIPQAEILARASAMVGHGGFGTTLGALLAGVPQVVVPIFADQPYNAYADRRDRRGARRPTPRRRRRSAPRSSACSPRAPSAWPPRPSPARRSPCRRSRRPSRRCSSWSRLRASAAWRRPYNGGIERRARIWAAISCGRSVRSLQVTRSTVHPAAISFRSRRRSASNAARVPWWA